MDELKARLNLSMATGLTGSVVRTEGMTVHVAGFPAPIGAVVEVERQTGPPLRGEVIGFQERFTIVYPFSELSGVRHGNRVRLLRTMMTIGVGRQLLGRVIDAHGRPIDGMPEPALSRRAALSQQSPPPVERPPIDSVLSTGVRAIDALLTCGRGQRLGVFSGSGVGKSVMLGTMARNTSADISVIGLIGERGREVNEFIHRDLGPEGLARSVVVVATSDAPALLRRQAAMTATTIAESFRDEGANVLLIMDSLTRFAMAQREIGLAAGEPPTTRGYPPSMFALMPRLVERAGRTPKGSITAFYSVLVEGDDVNEPVSDTVRGLLDGHVILSRKIASRGRYPAIDILESISRLMPELASPEQQEAAVMVRSLLSAYRDHEDLISIGAYRQGANPIVDVAIALKSEIEAFLRQGMHETATLENSQTRLLQLAQKAAAISTAAASQAAIPTQGATRQQVAAAPT